MTKSEAKEELLLELRVYADERNPGNTNAHTLEHSIIKNIRNSDPGDSVSIRDAIWELFLEGVLAPGENRTQTMGTMPNCRLTEYGRVVVMGGQFNPHVGAQYIRQLQDKLPAGGMLDKLVTEYLQEALEAFSKRLHRSAAVMLGGASERCMHILTEAVCKEPKTDKLKALVAKRPFDTAGIHTLLLNTLKDLKPHPELRDSLEFRIDSIFQLIRISRNDAGHPKHIEIDRDQLSIHLQTFPLFCERVYHLIAWLNDRSETPNGATKVEK